MKVFRKKLAAFEAAPSKRRWLYVPYDQLSDTLGDLATGDPTELGIVLVETPAKAARRRYHKQKLAWVLTQQRHFALEQAARGVEVRYVVADGGYADALTHAAEELGPLRVMRPAERELRAELAPLVEQGMLIERAHTGWLSTRDDFRSALGTSPPWRMDAFYKYMRQRTGLLMNGTKPVGGKFSFDAENRRAWRGDPPAPAPPNYVVDEITAEVGRLVEERFSSHPGELHLDRIPASLADIELHWNWALTTCLPSFGPFEDAMSTGSSQLFHTCISPLLNLHRLTPARVVRDALAAAQVPIASREGFLRQVLGWREFVRHVHEETDGFRRIGPSIEPPTLGATPSALDAHEPLPAAFWGTPSGLACLDHVVRDVLRDGYSHHITRLMVLSNIGTLIGVEPRALTDWFWESYIDAYDWVVEPNVLAMGTFAVGELMTTKPYVSGAGYIHKMSDYCEGCAFNPKRDCPLTQLYWAFLARHKSRFARNPRTAGPVASLARRTPEALEEDSRVLAEVRAALRAGRRLSPASLRKPRQGA